MLLAPTILFATHRNVRKVRSAPVDYLPTDILHSTDCVFMDGEHENDLSWRRSQRRRGFILNLCCIGWIAHLTLTSSKILAYSDHVPWIPQACPSLSHRLKWRSGLTSLGPAAVHLRPWNFLLLRPRCRTSGCLLISFPPFLPLNRFTERPRLSRGNVALARIIGAKGKTKNKNGVATLEHLLILEWRCCTESLQALWQSRNPPRMTWPASAFYI